MERKQAVFALHFVYFLLYNVPSVYVWFFAVQGFDSSIAQKSYTASLYTTRTCGAFTPPRYPDVTN